MNVTHADRDGIKQNLPEKPNISWLLKLIHDWIDAEQLPFPMGVLSTVNTEGHPVSRTVAIQSITEQGILFFTQKTTKKVQHLSKHPQVSFTCLLPSTERQITFQGLATPLQPTENQQYWSTYDQKRRLRFLAYGVKSGQTLFSQQSLDDELLSLQENYQEKLPDMPETYVGYRIIPNTIEFYQLNEHRLSDSLRAQKIEGEWMLTRFVP